MIKFFVDSASTYSGDIDNLFLLITVLVGFWFFLAEGIFFYFIWRFRKKDGVKAEYITGEEKHQKKWISIPHNLVLVCDVFVIAGAMYVWYNVKQNLPEPELKIRVIAQQWSWTFVQPGADGELDTVDDITTIDELHVKNDTLYHFELQSKDVLHSFSVPVFRLKQDMVPGRSITGWFKPTQTGEYDIQCAEMCGIGHGIMGARIFITDEEEHNQWIADNSEYDASTMVASIISPAKN